MENVTIITGPGGSGKSLLAKILSAGVLSQNILAKDLKNITKILSPATGVLVIEEFSPNNKNQIESLKCLATSEQIIIEPKTKHARLIPRPKLVVVCQDEKAFDALAGKHYVRHFKLSK